MKLSPFSRAILIALFCSVAAVLLLFRLPRARTLTGHTYTLDAYPVEFRDDGTVLRGPWRGRYELAGNNRICLGGWERLSGGGNMYSTPRGLYSYTLTDREISLTRVSASMPCPLSNHDAGAHDNRAGASLKGEGIRNRTTHYRSSLDSISDRTSSR